MVVAAGGVSWDSFPGMNSRAVGLSTVLTPATCEDSGGDEARESKL